MGFKRDGFNYKSQTLGSIRKNRKGKGLWECKTEEEKEEYKRKYQKQRSKKLKEMPWWIPK